MCIFVRVFNSRTFVISKHKAHFPRPKITQKRNFKPIGKCLNLSPTMSDFLLIGLGPPPTPEDEFRNSLVYPLVSTCSTQDDRELTQGGGGGTLIFSHIHVRRLGLFLVQNSEFQSFGFSEK